MFWADMASSFMHVVQQKSLPAKKTSRLQELPTIIYNMLIDLIDTDYPTAKWPRSSLQTAAEPLLHSMAAVLAFLQGSAEQLAKKTARLPASLVPLTQVKLPGASKKKGNRRGACS